jgi:octaprenyl-diphosphate synthase
MNTQPASIKGQILDLAAKELAEIEAALESNLTPWQELARNTAGHILFAGGKRLRPLLMVTCSKICGSDTPQTRRFSTIFEYLHAATLLHDDLVDGAALRRGKPAAHHLYGNETAVLTGDFLLARSLSIAADAQDVKIIRIIADITEQMSQGEIQQLHNRGRLDLSEAQYMDVIRRKTAVLIEGACHSGALLALAPQSQTEALKQYGHKIGMAFQMADDLLDYTSETTGLGKTVGADLKEGKLTLPLIAALKAASPEDRQWMEKILLARQFTDEEFQKFRTLLEDYGGISHTRDKAAEYVSDAKACLEGFPPSPHRTLLELIATYALIRKA